MDIERDQKETLAEESEQVLGTAETHEELDTSYTERADVNGIEMSIKFINQYPGTGSQEGDYEMYFPQIKAGDEARERGVSDSVIRISEDPEIAKKVFAYATEAAKFDGDVYSLYKKVRAFARELE